MAFNLLYASAALRECARNLGVRVGEWEPVFSNADGCGQREDYEDVKAIVFNKNGKKVGEVTAYDLKATGK